MVEAVVVGNVTLDVICQTVNDVPRHESIAFEHVAISPGGCGSNTAIGLAKLGVSTALVACMGADDAALLLLKAWGRFGLDTRFVRSIDGKPTGTSVGLVDSELQPRFIHTTGANSALTSEGLPIDRLADDGAKSLHVAGFFVLPGLLDGKLPSALALARKRGMFTSLDVVRSPRLHQPEALWPCLPYLNLFMCNAVEGQQITGIEDHSQAAMELCRRGSEAVVIKLGAAGCWLESPEYTGLIPGVTVNVVDTTGAGDAFAAGLLAARSQGADLKEACMAGNRAGAQAVTALGAITHYQG